MALVVVEARGPEQGDELALTCVPFRGTSLGGEHIGLHEDKLVAELLSALGGECVEAAAEEAEEGRAEEVAPVKAREPLAVVAHEDLLDLADSVWGRDDAPRLAIEVIVRTSLCQG